MGKPSPAAGVPLPFDRVSVPAAGSYFLNFRYAIGVAERHARPHQRARTQVVVVYQAVEPLHRPRQPAQAAPVQRGRPAPEPHRRHNGRNEPEPGPATRRASRTASARYTAAGSARPSASAAARPLTWLAP